MSSESDFAEAVAAHGRGDLARAERGYRAVLNSKPLEARHNLGVVLGSLGRFTEAEAMFRAALEVDPASPRPRHALAMLLLADGRYGEAWPLWEARRELPELEVPRPELELAIPEWTGEPLVGKRLLVFGEQGFGDKIMFARYLAPLQAMGAEPIFVCPPALHRLIGSLGIEIAGAEGDAEALRADAWILAGSLPLRFATTIETIPPPAVFAAQARPGEARIGVMTAGAGGHRNDPERSLPPRYAQRLLRLGRDLSPEATGAEDFLETAGIIAGLDLVITVDTAVAHLAGSLGKPVWILLPARDTDWRWLRGREDSPWYPSARLFRQRVPGDWEPVFRRLETELSRR